MFLRHILAALLGTMPLVRVADERDRDIIAEYRPYFADRGSYPQAEEHRKNGGSPRVRRKTPTSTRQRRRHMQEDSRKRNRRSWGQ